VAALLGPEAERAGVAIEIEREQAIPEVLVDPEQIQQVFFNVMLNSIQATPPGARVRVRRHQTSDGIIVEVMDDGPGIPAGHLSRIFDPFFTTKEKGTGLGLATVYGIVKQSGGHLWVYSEPGAGTTFKLYLPRVEGKGVGVPPQPRFEEKAAVTETVLLVEDEEHLRALAREFLEQRGYRVLEAGNGAEALQLAAAHAGPIHLLVTDMVMPGMRGRELADKLCASRPQMKVLYVSGYTDGSIVENGELGPGSAFLEKPFSSDALARKVRQVLNGAASGCDSPAGPKAVELAEREAGSSVARLESK
jgi:CheY-like chemotaxis protein